MGADNRPQTEMPKYRCHKVVHALQIERVEPTPNPQGKDFPLTLHFVEAGFAPLPVKWELAQRHPAAGGYYVVYGDGYESYSPKKAFEEGYTRI